MHRCYVLSLLFSMKIYCKDVMIRLLLGFFSFKKVDWIAAPSSDYKIIIKSHLAMMHEAMDATLT